MTMLKDELCGVISNSDIGGGYRLYINFAH